MNNFFAKKNITVAEKDPVLTIIIPAKNEANNIGLCIDYAKKSIDYWGGLAEIIVVDNGSTDSTVNIAVSKGVKILESKIANIACLRNMGAKSASGVVFAFIDADCLISPEWISYCLAALENPHVAGVGTRALPDMKKATWVEIAVASMMAGAERPDFVQWLGSSNLLIKKDVFWSVNGFNENLTTGEDVQFCKMLNKQYKFFLEKRINTIHLRESKTLSDLYKREFWRGKCSLSVYYRSKFDASELPSIIVPFINLICFFFVVVLLVYKSPFVLIYFLIILLFPVIFLLKKGKRIRISKKYFNLYIVSFTFLFSRTMALWYEICNLFFILFKRIINSERS